MRDRCSSPQARRRGDDRGVNVWSPPSVAKCDAPPVEFPFSVDANSCAAYLKGVHQDCEGKGRGERLGLSEDELAFYDALETNDSAVQVLGDDALRDIARQLVETVRDNVTIDWTLRENVRANLRRLVKRILRRHGYPPDKQKKATQTVIEQAEVLSEGWAVA